MELQQQQQQPLVEDILAKDDILCALMAQTYTEQEQELDWYPGGDAGRLLWFLTGMIDSVRNDPCWENGKHFGDCTNYAMSCKRCHLEHTYKETLATMDKFRELCTNREESPHMIKLLAILLGTQYLQSDWNACLMRHIYEQDPDQKMKIQKELDDMLFPDPTDSLQERWDIWDKLDNDGRKDSENLARDFVKWVVDRPLVPGW